MNKITVAAMKDALLVALVLVIYQLADYFFNFVGISTLLGSVDDIVIIGGLVWGMFKLRESEGGFVTFGRLFSYGWRFSACCGLVVGVFLGLLHLLDPSLIDRQIDTAELLLTQKGMSDADISAALEASKQMMTPGMMILSTFFSVLLTGLFFSLIAALFVKRRGGNPFSEVEEATEEKSELD